MLIASPEFVFPAQSSGQLCCSSCRTQNERDLAPLYPHKIQQRLSNLLEYGLRRNYRQ